MAGTVTAEWWTVGNRIPILCNQENVILRGNSYKINQSLPGFYCLINPAVKETHDKGRAKNGMFIAVPNSMKSCIEDVSPGYWRLQAIIIKNGNSRLLLINSYFPTDPLTIRFDDAELIETLEYLKKIFDVGIYFNQQGLQFLQDTRHTFYLFLGQRFWHIYVIHPDRVLSGRITYIYLSKSGLFAIFNY